MGSRDRELQEVQIMTEEQYVAKCEELLSSELPVESPDELMKAAVQVESLGYLATKFQAQAEKELRQADVELLAARAEAYNTVEGKTAPERQAKVESLVRRQVEAVAAYESRIKFDRNLSALIDRRVGLAQSTLANFSAQIKAGIITS